MRRTLSFLKTFSILLLTQPDVEKQDWQGFYGILMKCKRQARNDWTAVWQSRRNGLASSTRQNGGVSLQASCPEEEFVVKFSVWAEDFRHIIQTQGNRGMTASSLEKYCDSWYQQLFVAVHSRKCGEKIVKMELWVDTQRFWRKKKKEWEGVLDRIFSNRSVMMLSSQEL